MLRRRRGSVSTPRSGPSLFGPLVLGSPRPGGQPKSQKAFWAACFCTWAASGGQPRGRSVPGVASACWRGRRLRSRRLACARGAAGTRLLCLVGVRTRPPREAQRSLLGGATGLAMCGSRSNGVIVSRLVSLPQGFLPSESPRLPRLFKHFWVALNRKKHIATKRPPPSTSSPLRV